jgi:hypothetical protein
VALPPTPQLLLPGWRRGPLQRLRGRCGGVGTSAGGGVRTRVGGGGHMSTGGGGIHRGEGRSPAEGDGCDGGVGGPRRGRRGARAKIAGDRRGGGTRSDSSRGRSARRRDAKPPLTPKETRIGGRVLSPFFAGCGDGLCAAENFFFSLGIILGDCWSTSNPKTAIFFSLGIRKRGCWRCSNLNVRSSMQLGQKWGGCFPPHRGECSRTLLRVYDVADLFLGWTYFGLKQRTSKFLKTFAWLVGGGTQIVP